MAENTKNRILIVEDDEMVRSFVTIHMENNGFEVAGVSTGKAFFAEIEKSPADLIIFDLNLPDGDGLEFAAQFRETSNTPIIIASARKGMDDRLTALNLGSIDYVTKPFDPQELLLRIKNLLNISQEVTDQPDNQTSDPKIKVPQNKYLLAGAAATLLVIAAAGTGWYLGSSNPQESGAVKSKPAKIEVVNPPPSEPAKPLVKAPPQAPVQAPPPKPKPPIVVTSPPAAAQIEAVKCEALPEVQWWSNRSHSAIEKYVQRKYKGNWAPYILSWDRRLEKLVDILGRNSSAVASGGIVITGEDLEIYVSQVKKRIEIMNCLAGKQSVK